ncbi:MAG: globin family protein [Vulcanimicrobiota bacterium]
MSDVELLRTSFEALAPQAASLMERFYAILFERYPSVRPLFVHTDMRKQQGKLLASLALVVKHCDQPEKFRQPLRQMGERHLAYGTQPQHYDAVGECLLAALAETAGSLWTEELQAAWTRAYLLVAGEMLLGAQAGAASGA